MNKPEFTYNQGIVPSEEYHEWLKKLKLRYKEAQIKASVKVNSELIRFYWSLGKDIVAMKVEDHWGKGVLNQLSLDLKNTFPQQNGFSVTNLKYMKRWYSFYAQSDEIRHQVGDELEFPANFSLVPWRHHILIFTKSNSVKEALFYINKTIEGNWSRSTLEYKMEENLYVKQGNAVTNFSSRLPTVQGKLAEEVLKDPYKLDFLHLKEDYDEKDLEIL